MTAQIKGGCQCGALRYECTAEPAVAVQCHCRQCQKATGTGSAPLLAVPKEALTITGEVRYFDSRADSGNDVSRGFCPTCGGRLFGLTSGMPDLMAIAVGSLDDASWFKPAMTVFTAAAQPWSAIDDHIPGFPAMPPMADAPS